MPPRAPACQIGALVKWWAMEMQQLRYFLAVLEHGSFSRAADDLGRSQQAISRAIQTLEEQVGVRLLDRGAGRVRPTAFGQMLVVHARGIIGHDKAFRDELRAVLGSQRGSVRLGAGPAVAELAFAAVEAARITQPDLHVTLLTGIQQSFIEMLLEKSLDLAICVDNFTLHEPHPEVRREIFAYVSYGIYAGAQHPLAKASGITASALRDQRWVVGITSGVVANAWREAFVSAGLAPPIPDVESSSVEFCRAALVSGTWLTINPGSLFQQEIDAGTIVKLDAPGFSWNRPAVILYRPGRIREGRKAALIDILHQVGRQRG